MKKKFVFAVIIAMIFICMCACGTKIPTPTETTDTFLNAIKDQDSEILASVYQGGEINLLGEEEKTDETDESEIDSGLGKVFEEQMLPKMLDFEYEISNEKIDGNKATVDVHFKQYSMGETFNSFMNDYMKQALAMAFSNASEEEINSVASDILSQKLTELTEKNYEKTVTIPLSMIDDKWMVDEIKEGDEILDGITGGLMTAVTKLSDAFSEWEG